MPDAVVLRARIDVATKHPWGSHLFHLTITGLFSIHCINFV